MPAPWQPRIGEQATHDREQDGERDARRVPTSYDEEHGWVASLRLKPHDGNPFTGEKGFMEFPVPNDQPALELEKSDVEMTAESLWFHGGLQKCEHKVPNPYATDSLIASTFAERHLVTVFVVANRVSPTSPIRGPAQFPTQNVMEEWKMNHSAMP